MTNSPLLRLPPELRNEIFGMVIRQPATIVVHQSNKYNQLHHRTRTFLSQAQALTRTCKEIHQECGIRFCIENDFILDLNLVLTKWVIEKYLWPKDLETRTNKNAGPRSLRVNLPPTTRLFHTPQIIDGEVFSVTKSHQQTPLRQLSSILRMFRQQFPFTTLALRLPVNLKNRYFKETCRWYVEVDFRNPKASLDKAYKELWKIEHDLGREFFIDALVELDQWMGMIVQASEG